MHVDARAAAVDLKTMGVDVVVSVGRDGAGGRGGSDRGEVEEAVGERALRMEVRDRLAVDNAGNELGRAGAGEGVDSAVGVEVGRERA